MKPKSSKDIQKYFDEWYETEDENERDLIAKDLLVDLIHLIEKAHSMLPKNAKWHIKNLYKTWKNFCRQTAQYNDDKTITEYSKSLFGSAIVVLNQEGDRGKHFCLINEIPYDHDGIELFSEWLEHGV